MKIMWFNESLVLRGECVEEKKALNVLFQTIGNDGLDENNVSGILELVDFKVVTETGDRRDVPQFIYELELGKRPVYPYIPLFSVGCFLISAFFCGFS